jgi:transmembrane sensor
MDENYYRKLVKRYLDKKTTDEELVVFIHLMQQGILEKYLEEAMNEDLGTLTEEENHSSVFKNKVLGWLRWSVAATILIAAGTVIYTSSDKNPLLGFANKPNGFTTANVQTISNLTHFIHKQTLPDGSAVWLMPNSTLNYPLKFTGSFRKVSMQGEAFFDVTKDHAHPFTITSGKVLTKVWGTSFKIKSVPGEGETRVSVLSGKVSVSILGQKTSRSPQTEVMLKPKDEATYLNAKNNLLHSHLNALPSELKIWRKTNMVFENVPLGDVKETLEKEYDVSIEVNNVELRNYHISADFNGKNLPDVLMLICKIVHATYVTEGNKIVLTSNN